MVRAMSEEQNSRFVLHIGAHRTGSTLFQEYMFKRKPAALERGIVIDGIMQTRQELLARVIYDARPETIGEEQARLCGWVRQHLDEGRRVLISDENLIGTMERNLAERVLYPMPATRLARLGPLMEMADTLYLSVRSPAEWWTSCVTYLCSRVTKLPDRAAFASLARVRRPWAKLVGELAAAFPEKWLVVREFGYQTGNPKRQFREVTRWDDLGAFPNLKKKANSSKDAGALRERLIAGGANWLKDLPDAGGGLRVFTEDEMQAMAAEYLEDLAAIRAALKDRGRVLLSPEMKARLRDLPEQGAA